MLKYISYDIVFQEVPTEVSLAINLTNCPNSCKGCHSAHLQEDIGIMLTQQSLGSLLEKYSDSISCVCFMGGDCDVKAIDSMAAFVHSFRACNKLGSTNNLKVCWYSGLNSVPSECDLKNFDYIKLGPYVEALGGLDKPTSNQHFYRIDANLKMEDCSFLFQRKTFLAQMQVQVR